MEEEQEENCGCGFLINFDSVFKELGSFNRRLISPFSSQTSLLLALKLFLILLTGFFFYFSSRELFPLMKCEHNRHFSFGLDMLHRIRAHFSHYHLKVGFTHLDISDPYFMRAF